MNEQLTLQSTQHEETKTVPLRRRKACLAGTFALFAACALVLLIPHPAYAGVIGDFLDIPNMIKTWLLQIAATLFNTYFGVINQTLDAKFISGPFNELFHMNTLLGYPWNGMVGADLDGLEAYGFAYPLSTQAATDWLEGDDLAKVNAFLKETCKKVFGILPGADAGGYSLSGEAKEAALSRFALPENRKAALDMIRKLNESRDSNENAL